MAAMDSQRRRPLIVGNWKMHRTAAEAEALTHDIVLDVGQQTDVSVVLCPPFTALATVAKAIEGTQIRLGAQNMHPASHGAYTGEISAEMLRDDFVSYVIVGHSERRLLLGENDDFIGQKVCAALASNLRPILCVGETLAQQDAGEMLAVIREQFSTGVAGVSETDAENLVIAYEPVWAIGTGKTAAPEGAQEVHRVIRQLLVDQFSAKVAQRVPILYGGSVKPDNASALFAQADIDGGLIGGASLDARSFVKIIEAALTYV